MEMLRSSRSAARALVSFSCLLSYSLCCPKTPYSFLTLHYVVPFNRGADFASRMCKGYLDEGDNNLWAVDKAICQEHLKVARVVILTVLVAVVDNLTGLELEPQDRAVRKCPLHYTSVAEEVVLKHRHTQA